MLSGVRQQKSNGFERFWEGNAFVGRSEGAMGVDMEALDSGWGCLIPYAFI